MRRSSDIRYISMGTSSPSQPPGGFLGRIVAFVVGAIVLGFSIFVGAIFIAAIVGLALVGGLIVALRVWWVKRKMAQYQREHGDIDADYVVVDDDQPPKDKSTG